MEEKKDMYVVIVHTTDKSDIVQSIELSEDEAHGLMYEVAGCKTKFFAFPWDSGSSFPLKKRISYLVAIDHISAMNLGYVGKK